MSAFRYWAVQLDGAAVEGVVEANDRKSALQVLGRRGLYPSKLEFAGPEPAKATGAGGGGASAGSRARLESSPRSMAPAQAPGESQKPEASSLAARRLRKASPGGRASSRSEEGPSVVSAVQAGKLRVKRKEITAFTRELSALLGAAIPIPQALDGLAEEEENASLRAMVFGLSEAVRKGTALSTAMEAYPQLFSRLYVSMVRVGEEAGALPRVMSDLADLLEHEDEVRGEVVGAVAYPAFVLGFGIFTVAVLLTVVLPRLFGMLQEMLNVLPLPTLILLKVSKILSRDWPWILLGLGGAFFGGRKYLRTERGAEAWDGLRLKLPLIGAVFRSAALGRFARTLGTLVKSGVSLLPALRIVEDTIGNRVLAKQVALVSEETRGGDSLAAPLRKLAVFPKGVIQMIEVGEETGRLDEMLLKIAEIEERHMRAKTKTIVSLLAPALILVVGALVGFMVIALLLPIFKMSRAIH
jgi:type II secretory pathway component PulF